MNFPRMRLKWLVRIMIALLVIAATTLWSLRYPEKLKDFQKIFPSFSHPEREGWILEIKVKYPQCEHEETIKKEFASEKLLKRALEDNPEIHLESQQGRHFITILQKRKFCHSCELNRFLGIYQGKVAVFRGTPLKPGPIIELTEISASRLPQIEQEDLQKGIFFKSEKEKMQVLEGLASLIDAK